MHVCVYTLMCESAYVNMNVHTRSISKSTICMNYTYPVRIYSFPIEGAMKTVRDVYQGGPHSAVTVRNSSYFAV